LRLIVVNTRDPNAGCRALPWNPDKSECDYDGILDKRFGVNGKLPSAFLWSWQGNLLEQGAHIDDIEAAVQRYLDDAPRVVVEAEAPRDSAALQALVQSELTRTGKFTVLSSKKDRARLQRLRKETHRADKRDDQRCELGQEVSPNSVVIAKRFRAGTAGERLTLSLESLETGCLTEQVSVPWQTRDAAAAVEEAVVALLDRLRKSPQVPGGKTSPRTARVKEQVLDTAPTDDWDPTASAGGSGFVRFSSNPPGAQVLINGKAVCTTSANTPCKKYLPLGPTEVVMQLPQYVEQRQRVTLRAGKEVAWDLSPDFATLTLQTNPPGVSASVDGQSQGTAATRVSAGAHRLAVNDPCFYPVAQELSLKRGETRTVTLPLKSRPAGLFIRAQDEAGNDLQADVRVDGRSIGQSFSTLKLPLCPGELTVSASGYGTWSLDLKQPELVEKAVSQLKVTLTRRNQRGSLSALTRAKGGSRPAAGVPKGQLTVVQLQSSPDGALVTIDGRSRCRTPCAQALTHGSHRVEMALAAHVTGKKTLTVGAKPETLRVTLESDTAPLRVTSSPSGLTK
jgi:hypothetical protein